MVINKSLHEKIDKYLKKIGITPVLDADTTNGSRSLIVDQKLDEFSVSTSFSPGNIIWSPSLPNWNPWRATNIDEKPLAFVRNKNFFIKKKFTLR